MFTFHRTSYLTAFIRPIEPGLHMAPNTDFMGRSDPPYSILPASEEHVKIKEGEVKTMIEVDCQSFSGVPFLKIYRHITLAKDYTLITFPKGR